jgi:hypothetical protein
MALLISALVWAEGYYNGAIRTRKTTMTTVRQPAGAEDAGDEETALRRSRQLTTVVEESAARSSSTSSRWRWCRRLAGPPPRWRPRT